MLEDNAFYLLSKTIENVLESFQSLLQLFLTGLSSNLKNEPCVHTTERGSVEEVVVLLVEKEEEFDVFLEPRS